MPVSRPSRFAPCALLCSALLLGALATPAHAASAPKPKHGGLPSIGAISLAKGERGRLEISVPVTYTKALAGPPLGLESARVTLHIARQLRHGRPLGTEFVSSRYHRVPKTKTIVDRFTLPPSRARWLLGKSGEQRGQLVRVDVQHLIKERRRGPVLHRKAASLNLASSHRARPQGASGELTLRNATSEPIETVATPIMCMYTWGEEGSNLQLFSTQPVPYLPASPLAPGGTIEAEIEADASVLDDAEYQGPQGQSAGSYFDVLGLAADGIAHAFGAELFSVFSLMNDLSSHCDAVASVFSLAAASAEGTTASLEAWVLTDENCRFGCPHEHLISAYDALGFQSPGEENGSEIWASASTELLESFVGYYNPAASNRGQIVQDNGLHFEWDEYSSDGWEVTVGAGSKPAGFSG